MKTVNRRSGKAVWSPGFGRRDARILRIVKCCEALGNGFSLAG